MLRLEHVGGNLKYLRKPDAVPSLFRNGQDVNKSGSSIIGAKDTKTTKLREVKVSV